MAGSALRSGSTNADARTQDADRKIQAEQGTQTHCARYDLSHSEPPFARVYCAA